MYTIEQLFTRAASLVDSLKNDGTVDTNSTADYRARTLTLVDLALKKLNQSSDFYKIFEFNITLEDESPWTKVELPTDFKSIKKIIIQPTEGGYYALSEYNIESDQLTTNLYLKFDVDGVVRVQYKSMSTIPTAFTDEVEIDDVCAAAICYDLAINFAATEMSFDLVNFFKGEYNQLKNDIRRPTPSTEVAITDYYGCIF